jgi:hypothetical protein
VTSSGWGSNLACSTGKGRSPLPRTCCYGNWITPEKTTTNKTNDEKMKQDLNYIMHL